MPSCTMNTQISVLLVCTLCAYVSSAPVTHKVDDVDKVVPESKSESFTQDSATSKTSATAKSKFGFTNVAYHTPYAYHMPVAYHTTTPYAYHMTTPLAYHMTTPLAYHMTTPVVYHAPFVQQAVQPVVQQAVQPVVQQAVQPVVQQAVQPVVHQIVQHVVPVVHPLVQPMVPVVPVQQFAPPPPEVYAVPAPPQPRFNAAPCTPNNPHMANPMDGYIAAYMGTCNDQVQEFLEPGTLAHYSHHHNVVLFIGAGVTGIKMTEGSPYPYLSLENNIDEALHDIDQKFGGKDKWVAVFNGEPVSTGGIGNVMFYIRNKGYRVVAFQSWMGLSYNAPENANCAAVEATAVDYVDRSCRHMKTGGITQKQVYYKRSKAATCVRDESRHEDSDSTNLLGATSHYLDRVFKLAAAVKIGEGQIAQQELALLGNRKGVHIYEINVECNPGKWTGFNPRKGMWAPQGNSEACPSAVAPPPSPMALVPIHAMPVAQYPVLHTYQAPMAPFQVQAPVSLRITLPGRGSR